MSLKFKEKILIVFFIPFVLFCCTKTKQIREEDHLAYTDNKSDQKQEQVVDNKTTGAEDVTTSSSVKDLAIEVQDPDGGVTLSIITPDHPLKIPVGSKVIGSVPIKETSNLVTDHKDPIVENKVVDSSESSLDDVGLKMDKVFTETDTEKVSPWPSLWLIGLVSVGLFVAVYLVKKFTLVGKIVSVFQKLF